MRRKGRELPRKREASEEGFKSELDQNFAMPNQAKKSNIYLTN